MFYSGIRLCVFYNVLPSQVPAFFTIYEYPLIKNSQLVPAIVRVCYSAIYNTIAARVIFQSKYFGHLVSHRKISAEVYNFIGILAPKTSDFGQTSCKLEIFLKCSPIMGTVKRLLCLHFHIRLSGCFV